MADQPLSIADRVEILDLISTYAWKLDMGDAQGVADCFTADVVFDDAFGKFTKAKDATDFFFNKRDGFRGRQHLFTNHLVRGTTEAAEVRYFCTVLKWDTISTDTRYIHLMAWCEDKCVKLDGRWLIKSHIVHRWNDLELPWVGPMADGKTLKDAQKINL